jgi:hypothetical protein
MAVRRVALLAVGVDRTQILTKLNGAASGAQDFARWLGEQGEDGPNGVKVTSTVLTDAKGEVTSRQVRDEADRFIKKKAYDLLILYFAGHGIIKSGGDEQVLLSGIARYNDEAIDIATTAKNARTCGISHVMIISDACRSPTTYGGDLDQVSGQPAFPRGAVTGVTRSEVDVFYATEPSRQAKEYKGVGFFTEYLLSVLRDSPPEIHADWPKVSPARPVVPAKLLATYVTERMAAIGRSRDADLDQTPELMPGSYEPKFVAFARRSLARPSPASAPAPEASTIALKELPHALVSPDVDRAITLAKDAGVELPPTLQIDPNIARRQSFETRTGYLVIGSGVEFVLVHSPVRDHDEVLTPEGIDIRLYPRFRTETHRPETERENHRGSLIMGFPGGTVSVLPVMPGYIGVLKVIEGRVQSLSFQLSENERKALRIPDEEVKLLEERRKVAAGLAASGRLWHLTRADGTQLATFLRQGKRMDPTLGIYSAYAYATAGNDDQVLSIFRWTTENYNDRPLGTVSAPVPFDVAMLAGRVDKETAWRQPGFAPFCPLMTLGWSLLGSYPAELDDSIRSAGKYRLNALWATFKRSDVKPMLAAFEAGRIE